MDHAPARDAVNISAVAPMAPCAGDEGSERAGVTKQGCFVASGCCVAKRPAHLEGCYLRAHRLPGNNPADTVDVVYGRVERIHVNDMVPDPGSKLDIAIIQPIARMGYDNDTRVRDVFEMCIPGASDEAAAGLDGRT